MVTCNSPILVLADASQTKIASRLTTPGGFLVQYPQFLCISDYNIGLPKIIIIRSIVYNKICIFYFSTTFYNVTIIVKDTSYIIIDMRIKLILFY